MKNAMAAVIKGNKLFDKGQATAANVQYARAANSLLHSSFGRYPRSGRIAGTVSQLGYYFAVIGDEAKARQLWRLFVSYGATDSNEDVVNMVQWGRFPDAFRRMLEHDIRVISNGEPQPDAGKANVIRNALSVAAHGKYKSAERLLRIALNCRTTDSGYALYGLGVTYMAMRDRVRARYAFLASSIRTGFVLPDMDPVAPSNARAMRMLLAFY